MQCASCYVATYIVYLLCATHVVKWGNYGPFALMAETRDQFTVLVEN